MIRDKSLDFSTKYNWWTSEVDKKNISLETKIEYILARWDLEDIAFLFKNIDINLIKEVFEKRKIDNFLFDSKRISLIKALIEIKINLWKK